MSVRKDSKAKAGPLDNYQKAYEKIGMRLIALRIKKGYTNAEHFAWEIGISRSQYHQYEKGSNITIRTLLKILEFHGLTLEEFFQIKVKE